MTDDLDLVRLAAHTERAGSKLVLIGDHRQLGAVGPGGALHALIDRHPDAVHYLTGNRRQTDPDERAALAQLREGDITTAVSWYERQGRIHAVPGRDAAVQAAVEAWAADIAAGHDTALHAWRKGNVAALNQAARQWMVQTGRLSGSEVVCPGGAAYRAGDQVVTLAPGPDGSLVTSQRAVVIAVDPHEVAVTVETHDARTVTLTGAEAGADRLSHGYATTVHRSQGATVSRAHLFADGGGRELAYVAMSRARQSTHIWANADNTAQAVEDLQRDWAIRRNTGWAIDIGQPETSSEPRPAEHRARIVALAAAEISIKRAAIGALTRPVLHQAVDDARTHLDQLRRGRQDLTTGRGVYQDTQAGQAIRDLQEATQAAERAAQQAEEAGRWRDRRTGRRDAAAWAERKVDAEQRYRTHVEPEAARLDAQISHCGVELARLELRADAEQARYRDGRQLEAVNMRQATRFASTLNARRDRLDGIREPIQRRIGAPSPVPSAVPELEAPAPQITM